MKMTIYSSDRVILKSGGVLTLGSSNSILLKYLNSDIENSDKATILSNSDINQALIRGINLALIHLVVFSSDTLDL